MALNLRSLKTQAISIRVKEEIHQRSSVPKVLMVNVQAFLQEQLLDFWGMIFILLICEAAHMKWGLPKIVLNVGFSTPL